MSQKILKFKEDIAAYLLLFFGFIFRLYYVFTFTTPEKYLFSDPGAYDLRALQMAKDQYVLFSTYWPPFFHIIFSVLYRFLIWIGIISWRIKIDVIIFALLHTFSFWCIYQIVKKLFPAATGWHKNTALIILAVLVIWYPFIFFNYLIMSENLFIPLFFFGLYILITKPQNFYTGLLLGFLWGCALLTRPIFALALPFFVIWSLFYKINWKFLISFVLVAFTIIISMMIFNFYYTKGAEKSISSNGGAGFTMLWCDAKSLEFRNKGYVFGFGPPSNIDYPDDKRIFTNVPFENQKYYYQMGWECLKENPLALLVGASSVRNVFESHLFPTIANVWGWEALHVTFKILANLLFVLSLISVFGIALDLIKVDAENKKYFYFMGLVLLSLFVTIFIQNPGEERYLIPYEPLLIILSIPAVLGFYKILKNLWKQFQL